MQRNDRSYKDLKQKQKSAIADKTYKMYLKFYLENQRMPDAAEIRDNLTKEEILQDDRFFFIAGYTSGGAPYGVTWEEMGLKPWEDLEENE